MNKFRFTPTGIAGLYLVEPHVFGDDRGYFMETYNAEFAPYVRHLDGTPCAYVQDNESSSRRGVLRGLHLQLTQPQGKLVRVIEGEVFDVAVDVRPGSPTFGQWYGTRLSADNKRQLLIPEGFLHGYLTLTERARFVYKCTRPYAPEDEYAVRWDDPALAIAWPLDAPPTLSAKDEKARAFADLQALIAKENGENAHGKS